MNTDIRNYFTDGIDPQIRDEGLRRINSGEVAVMGFSGKKGSGKDTISQFVAQKFKEHALSNNLEYPFNHVLNNEIVEHPFAYALKQETTGVIDAMDSILKAGISVPEMTHRVSKLYNIEEKDVADIYSTIRTEINNGTVLIPNGWTRTKEVWEILRFLGTEIRQGQDPYYWVKQTFDSIVKNACEGKNTFINDVRFKNEIEPLILLGGFVTRVDVSPEAQLERLKNRDDVIPTPEALNHRSEVELDYFTKFHYRFDNSENGGLENKSQNIFDIWYNSNK